jgi:predicted AAA+ superfamily ATPase
LQLNCKIVRLYPPLFYWRTKDSREVDFVIEKGGRFIAYETKLTGMPSPSAHNTYDAAETTKGQE